MSKTVSIKTCVGIGDILHIKAQLDAVKHQYEKISIGPDDSDITLYRNNDDRYRKFVRGLFDLLFTEKPYVIDPHVSGDRKNPYALWADGFEPVIPRLAHLLCDGVSVCAEPYVVVHTKLRGFRRSHYNDFRADFLRLIATLACKYRVVLLGERTIGSNAEYRIHGPELIFSIYEDLLTCLPEDKIIDRTVPELGFTSPELPRFLEECLIQNKATHVITLGSGGNVSIAMSVGNSIGYYGQSQMEAFFDRMLENDSDKNVFLTTDLNRDFEKLASLSSVPYVRRQAPPSLPLTPNKEMKNIKHIIEEKRQSHNPVWKILVQAKDFAWRLKRALRNNRLTHVGKRIITDHFKEWEPKDEEVYLDVVARTGDVIGIFKQKFPGVKVKIVAVEANPNAVAAMKRGYTDVFVIQKGAWNKQGKASLSLPKNLDFLGEVSENRNPDTSLPRFDIEVDTLDHMLSGLGISAVDFVKIDTEGAEPQVLEGFTKYKKGTKFHIEFHRNENRVLDILKSKGIKINSTVRWPADVNQKVTAGQGEIFAQKE